MRFQCGTSRAVILIGPYAIKIARFPILVEPFRIAVRWQSRGIFRQKVVKNMRAPVAGFLKLLLAGVRSNLCEYRIARTYPNLPIAATLYTCFGLINIQRRAQPFAGSDEELEAAHPFAWMGESWLHDADVRCAAQFGWVDGKLVLVDAGSLQLEFYLDIQAKTKGPLERRIPGLASPA